MKRNEIYKGDLCRVLGYGELIWEVKESTYDEYFNENIYTLQEVYAGAYMEALSEDVIIICRSSGARTFLKIIFDEEKTKTELESKGGRNMKNPKEKSPPSKATEKMIESISENVKQMSVDSLLDELNILLKEEAKNGKDRTRTIQINEIKKKLERFNNKVEADSI